MRDPKRIPRILQLIEDLWHLNPDWRIGQLLVNVHRVFTHPAPLLFHVEDNVWEQELHDWVQQQRSVQDRGHAMPDTDVEDTDVEETEIDPDTITKAHPNSSAELPKVGLGDVMQLNSGGPKMTVTRIGDNLGVVCQWFQPSGILDCGTFLRHCLTHWKSEEPRF